MTQLGRRGDRGANGGGALASGRERVRNQRARRNVGVVIRVRWNAAVGNASVFVLIHFVAMLLPACGGDGDPGTTPTPSPEATASPSPAPTSSPAPTPERAPELSVYDVPAGSQPHDVAPAADGGVWYTAQATGRLGWLDPASGETREVPLGAGSAPHGVIVGPDGAPWVTDSGLNAIVRVDPQTSEVTAFPLPADRPNANLNTAAFDGRGVLWFTGQNGIVGRLNTSTGVIEVFDAPRGRGPYGITSTPSGDIYYASLAGSYVGRVDNASGASSVLEPPTPGQGARRVWSDSAGRIWVSEWNAGQVSAYDPSTDGWQTWRLPGDTPQAYAVYVDETGKVWLSDFAANALVRFDPETEIFDAFPLPDSPGNVRQLLGREREVWGAESAADRRVVVRY